MTDSTIIAGAITAQQLYCERHADVPLWENGPTGTEYWAGLVRIRGKRNRGSFVEGLDTWEKTEAFLRGLTFVEFAPAPMAARPGCRYFRAGIPEGSRAYQGVVSVREARLAGLQIRRHAGSHGWELAAQTPSGLAEAKQICIILEDGRMSTWYPGEIFPDTPRELPEDRALWDESWPVKLEPVPAGPQKSA